MNALFTDLLDSFEWLIVEIILGEDLQLGHSFDRQVETKHDKLARFFHNEVFKGVANGFNLHQFFFRLHEMAVEGKVDVLPEDLVEQIGGRNFDFRDINASAV